MVDSSEEVVILDRFTGGNPVGWIYQAERYFNFFHIPKDYWLSLAPLYLNGGALAWFNWLYRNDQFFDWKHFTEKLVMHFQKRTFANSVECLACLSQTRFDYVHFEIYVPPKAQRPALAPLSNSLDSFDGVDCLPASDLEAKPASDDDAPKPPTEIPDAEATTPASSMSSMSNCLMKVLKGTLLQLPLIVAIFNDKLNLKLMEICILLKFFMETESFLDLYLDKFFMENEYGIPTSAMPSDKIVPEGVHGKSYGGV
ncbi:hypothetical protein A4A49_51181 [Nicotiana attenuata]|uniref:Retrotransposon gag domain-containing protein n=1 Tax=Nicotiana attenuata TaxID=49451 RepID=A0A314LE79_NICAT|nr:hypothetical protein A4A49_51181 [Nicotiana attenuata]